MNPAQSNTFFTAMVILVAWTTFIRNQCLAANPYCNVNCTDEEHVLCEDAPCKAKCENSQCHPPTASAIESFLRAANEFRSSVAIGGIIPSMGAENMLILSWDKELELIAQCMLSNCDFDYPLKRTKCRKKLNGVTFRTNKFTFVEDVDKVEDGCPRLEAVMKIWVDRETARKIPSDFVKAFDSTVPDNLKDTIQMMWATTTKVGCGCRSFEKSVTQTRLMLFCNFAPGGLVNGESIYNVGSPNCAKYNLVSSRKHMGMCEPKPEHLEPEVELGTDRCEYYPPVDNTTSTSSTTSTTMTATKNDATTTTGGTNTAVPTTNTGGSTNNHVTTTTSTTKTATKTDVVTATAGTMSTAVPTRSRQGSTNNHVTTTRKLPSKATTRRDEFTFGTTRARSKVPSTLYDDRVSTDLWKTTTTTRATMPPHPPSNEPNEETIKYPVTHTDYRTAEPIWHRKTTIRRHHRLRNFTMFHFADIGLEATIDRIKDPEYINKMETNQSPRSRPGWMAVLVFVQLSFVFVVSLKLILYKRVSM